MLARRPRGEPSGDVLGITVPRIHRWPCPTLTGGRGTAGGVAPKASASQFHRRQIQVVRRLTGFGIGPMRLFWSGSARLSKTNLGLLPVSGWDRVEPTQTAKPRKITVCGAQRKTVFHSQCGQMGIWYEIAMHSRQREKFA
jgi:hypothetical protein